MTKPILLSAITSSLLFGALEIERAVFSSVGGEWENEEYKMNLSFASSIVGDFEDRVENNETVLIHRNLGHYSNPEDYNIEPVVRVSTSVMTNEDTGKRISVLIHDEENDEIQTTIKSYPRHGTLSASSSLMNYSPSRNYYGSDYATVEFNDGFGGIVTKKVRIYVSPVDDFPYLTPISSQTADEDSFALTVEILISDIDSDIAKTEYSVENSNSGIVEASMSDSNLILTPLPDQFGESEIKVSATLDGKTVSRAFAYTLNPLDDAPTLKEITNQNVLEDSDPLSIQIGLSDIDSNLTNAIYVIKNSNEDIATAEVSETNLVVTPIENMFGSAIITVFATLDEHTVETTFNYNLESVDDAPTLQKIDNYKSVGETNEIPLNLIDVDSDLTNAVFSVESSNSDVATGTIVDGKLIITPTGNKSGYALFEVSATLDEHSVSQIFQYTVELPNEETNESIETEPVESLITISGLSDLELDISSKIQTVNIPITIDSVFPITSVSASASSEEILVSNTEDSVSLSVLGGFSGTSTITLIVIDENGESFENSFTVTTSITENLVCLHNSANDLSFDTIRGSNERQDYITSSLNLVSSLNSCEVDIPVSWTSSNQDAISNSGEVMPTEENSIVQLVATIGESGETKKNFLLTVRKDELSDEDAVKNNIEILTFTLIKNSNLKLSEIYSPLNLPTSGVSDAEISWSSSSEAIDSDGSIYPSDEDISVTLTATITKGEVSETKLFSLILKGETAEDIDIVNNDKKWLSLENILGSNSDSSSIEKSLNLPNYGANGSEIEWISSNINVVSETGDVIRDSTSDKYVKLVAILTSGNESVEKVFPLKVSKAIGQEIDTGLSFDRVENSTDENNTAVSMFLKKDNDEVVSSQILLAKILEDVSEKLISNESVKVTIETETGKASILLKSDGTSTTKFETFDESGNSFETKTEIAVGGAKSEVSEDGTIVTTTDSSTVEIAKDGKVETHTGNATTKINLAGGTVSIDEDTIKTIFEEVVGDKIFKAEISTDNDFESKTSFTVVDLETGEEASLANTLADDQNFDENSTFKIDKTDNDELMIEIETEISTDLEFK
jgi:hypothetical protein